MDKTRTMGHYASEMQSTPTKKETELALKLYDMSQRIRSLPFSALTVGDFKEVEKFHKYGLQTTDTAHIKFWEEKLEAWEKNHPLHILKG